LACFEQLNGFLDAGNFHACDYGRAVRQLCPEIAPSKENPCDFSLSCPIPEDYVHMVMNEKPDWVPELISVSLSREPEPESFPDQKRNRETRHLRV
jgi:hypothetical protein